MASQGQHKRNCTVFRAELRKQRGMFRAWLAPKERSANQRSTADRSTAPGMRKHSLGCSSKARGSAALEC